MRLLKASSIELEEFPPNQIPPYAILSHTWLQEEVLFDDIQRGTAAAKPTAWSKVQSTCYQAISDGLEYVWIDSCCIDKSSSAELSETINSMYAWYGQASICYAYLSDVSAVVDPHKPDSAFAQSRWFRRGFTLQELLAPSHVVFFSQNWVEIGSKGLLCDTLSQITRIDKEILLHQRSLDSISVARRMAWAAHRQTTRPEDVAYCLMGIFSVNMPMLYGEGERAFLRLQDEIMKQSDDHSIFAWVDHDASPTSLHGLLAKSPSQFASCHDIVPYEDWEPRRPYTSTNRGLEITLRLTRYKDDVYVAALDCPSPSSYENSTFLGIFLKRLSAVDEQYARTKAGALAEIHQRGSPQTIYVRQTQSTKHGIDGIFPTHVLQTRSFPLLGGYRVKIVAGSSSTPNHGGGGGAETNPILSTRSERGLQHAYKIAKGVDSVVALVAFKFVSESDDAPGVLVALGSSKEFDVGFDAFDTRRPWDFEPPDLKVVDACFEPKRPGTWFELDNFLVQVSVEPKINLSPVRPGAAPPAAAKYFMVDIRMEPIFRSANPITALAEAIQTATGGQRRSISPLKEERKLENKDKELTGKSGEKPKRRWRLKQ